MVALAAAWADRRLMLRALRIARVFAKQSGRRQSQSRVALQRWRNRRKRLVVLMLQVISRVRGRRGGLCRLVGRHKIFRGADEEEG